MENPKRLGQSRSRAAHWARGDDPGAIARTLEVDLDEIHYYRMRDTRGFTRQDLYRSESIAVPGTALMNSTPWPDLRAP
jgi:hypothetical protein